MEHVHEYNNVA